ncbi:MAG TPA: Hsp20/alpha crystallin family protein, partial [Flavisolibacter sp.]
MTYVRLKKQLPTSTFNNLLENIYSPFAFLSGTPAGNGEENSAARVNIKELTDKYELHLVAPGFAKEDFEIKLEKDLL